MAYKKYKPEIVTKIKRLRTKKWGYRNKQDDFFLTKIEKIDLEIKRIKADPNNYIYEKGNIDKKLKSARAHLSMAKKKWPHRVPILQERLRDLLNAG